MFTTLKPNSEFDKSVNLYSADVWIIPSHLSAIESDHFRVIWRETPHTSLPPPAPAAAGEFSLWAQRRAEAVHGHMLVQQTAETDTQA